MNEHRIFVCDGTRTDNEVIQEAIDWVAEDKENRTATIEGTGDKTTELESFRARVEFCRDSEFKLKAKKNEIFMSKVEEPLLLLVRVSAKSGM